MSNLIINHKNKYFLMVFLLILVFVLASCSQADATETVTAEATQTATLQPTAVPTATPQPTATPYVWTAGFQEPKILGSSRGIFCADTAPLVDFEEIGFELQSPDGTVVLEQSAVLFEDAYYVQISDMTDNYDYTLKMYYTNAGKKTYSADELKFTTPKKIYTDKEVNSILNKALRGTEYSAGTYKYYVGETKKALQLLNINIAGSLGSNSYYLQMNQIKLEYSFNSYGRYVNWDKVDAKCDEESVSILKDIISVSENITTESFFYPFVPSPHILCEYNKYDEVGGQFDTERYLYDVLVDDEEIHNWYLEYPFIYDTPEFQEKYADLIKTNEGSDELSVEIQEAVALNKFMFSFYNRPWLDIYSIPQDRTISFIYIGTLTVQAATAYSYLVTEVPDEYEKLIMIQSTRDYSTQASFYTRKAGMRKATEYSAAWHLERQQFSYVPGFSNHHFGISIDFNDIQNFRTNPLYGYLQENAERYGFYNYLPEPWHWTYMGE